MTLLIENSSLDPLNTGFIETNDNTIQNNELITIPSIKHTLSVKTSRTILLEKKIENRSQIIQVLKFPQLTVCYHFNYHNFDFSLKKIKYSVLTDEVNNLEIPINQIKLKTKKINPLKLSIPQKEKAVIDLITRSRVLLMKSQLSLQNKPIPIDIERLAINFMNRNKKKIFQ